MKVLRVILIVLVFVCLAVGLFLTFFGKMFVSKRKNTADAAHRKELKIKLIGYIFLMLALAFGLFQSMINV